MSVGAGSVCGVGQAGWRARDPGKGKCAVAAMDSPVVLRIGMDGAVTRVPFVADGDGAKEDWPEMLSETAQLA